MFIFSVFLGLHLFIANAAQFDPPDLAYESDLHRQYLNARQSDGGAQTLARDAYVEDYRIQKGETLWSLSRILYGDGTYWPRVWAQNHSITNPHLVRQGHTLQVLLGSEDDTPAFRFTEEPDNSGIELAASNSNPLIEIPPPEIPPKPVLRLPVSFPEWQTVFKAPPKALIDDRGLEYQAKRVADRIFLRAYVDEVQTEPVGHFLEIDKEAGLPVINQYVYIKVKKGAGHEGMKMMIVHEAGEIRETNPDFDMQRPAYLIQIAGELQIVEGVSCDFSRSRDRESYDCFRALMTKTTGLSLYDNSLIPGELPIVDLSPNGPRSGVLANIVGSEHHISSMLYGQGDIVFLDKGSADGVQVGQMLDLYMARRTRHPDTPVDFSPARSGVVKVVRTSPHLSTAVILDAHDSVLQGDRVTDTSESSSGDDGLSEDPSPGESRSDDDLNLDSLGDDGGDESLRPLQEDSDLEKEIESEGL